MALFPAFAASASTGPADDNKELNWLRNESFCTKDALSLHQRSLQAEPPSPACLSSPSPGRQSSDSEDGSEAGRKKKKKKKKKKKHKELKRRKRDNDDDASDSASEKRKGPESCRSEEHENEASQKSAPGVRSIWLEEAQPAAEETFRIDKKADPANWEYKSLYRGDIARYRRKGRSCLGIDPTRQLIVWEDAPGKKPSHKKPERYYSRSAVQALRIRAEHVACSKDNKDVASVGFIPVIDCNPDAPSASAARTSWVNPLGVYDDSTAMWLQGKGGLEDKTPPAAPRDTELLGRVEDYNRRTRENPGDVRTWMEFVSFQDELLAQPSMYSTSEGEVDCYRMSVKLLLEKKLSILDRAIESNPGSTELKLARLRLCAEFWEAPALLKEWQKLVFLHPNDPQLWQRYLLFSQSQFSTFSVSKVMAAYGKCLTTLAAVHDGSMVSHPAVPGTERAMCEIFLQQCHFLRQAGHCEKAVSLFQALIDFTFYKPDSVKDMTTKGQVEFFEPFWDSGEPRFGEKGAKGWSSWMRQQEKGGWVVVNNLGEEEDDDVEEELDIKDKSLPRHKTWLDMECLREARHWLPWRPDPDKKQTEEDCEDPERQVLFDDLGPSMFRITSPALKFQFIHSFLQFLGVPCGPRPSPACLYLALDELSLFDHRSASERLLTSFELPLAGVGTVGHLETMSRWRRQIGHCKDGECFIQNVFQSALSLFHGEQKMELCVSWLQYEISKVVQCIQAQRKKQLKSQGKRSKRLAKSLLKEPSNRNSLALWKEYALLEWLLGNTEEARKVFDAAISLAGGKGLKDQALCSLCLLYAELEGAIIDPSEGGGRSRAVHVLTSLAESSPYKPYSGPVQAIHILKARKTYARAVQDSLNLPPSASLVTLTGCYALFQYLTVGIDAAVAVFREVTGSLPPPASVPGESQDSHGTLQAVAGMHINLLMHHTKVSVYPRTPLRDALSDALRLYPDNITLWKSYIQTESRSHNISKARRFIDGVRRTSDALEPYLFAIRAEEDRKKLLESVQRADMGEVHTFMPETGLSNRIKALFEHCVSTERGSRCVLLWRMYLHFMVSLGRGDRGRGLFYKAIQSCPWAKVLYMDAVEYFPEQLQEVADLMTEKELRVRLPLEELDLLLED
ncbi:PREDICTED: protein NRDE2 homolog [Nanorana parkeri]|uniref:protein NRDE2 homolog n=1 Tax=Nanorana parkeri TaxID=125878 RepID=UPI00085408D1|nr:PREDICTED: protein NRDE2 homolog [Nanorana parkeri]